VKAVCTTRAGGVSLAPFASMNLGNTVGDAAQQTQRNQGILRGALGAKPVFLKQVHGVDTLELTPETPSGLCADGAFTPSRGLACTVTVADCLPVLLCDQAGTLVAAVHAGWRGLAGAQGEGVLEAICKRFEQLAPVNSAGNAIRLIAWLGPCIGPQAFEVGPEVRGAFMATGAQAQSCFTPLPGQKWLADLPALARQRLEALGVLQVYGNDGSASWCTYSNPSRFFSYRRDGVTGRQAACIWLG
jgi:YfiH family protein